jgi:hypothetical protein
MRRLFALFLALASLFGAGALSAETLAITHVVVIDATGAPPQPDMMVIMRDGRIAELGASATVHAPADAKTVDGSDANPLEDIGNTHKIRGVVLAGRYVDRPALDRMLRGVAAAAATEPVPAKQEGSL